jgi:hypothetical protein
MTTFPSYPTIIRYAEFSEAGEGERVRKNSGRVERKRKLWGRSETHFIYGRGERNVYFLFEVSQARPFVLLLGIE